MRNNLYLCPFNGYEEDFDHTVFVTTFGGL